MECSVKFHVLWIGILLVSIRLLTNRFKRGLRDIPGPTIAKYTRLWRLYSVWRGDHHTVAIDLHRDYGCLVRIGPNHISVADPDAVPIIYGLNTGFTKTGFYPIQSISLERKPQMNLFSTRDEDFHRSQKRTVASAYSMSSLLELESRVDSCTNVFYSKLRNFCMRKCPIDIGVWLQYYAFDVIGEVTFSKKLGFLEEGRDIDGMIRAIQGILSYATLCGQIPEVHHLLLGNPLLSFFMPSMETWDRVRQFTLKAIDSRSVFNRNGEKAEDNQNDGKDMLSRWMRVHKSDSEKLSFKDIIVHTSTNVFAGSDTTAIALRSTLYLLLHHPIVMDKVQAEIHSAASDQKLSDMISYRESVKHLPYLGAVLKEAMRLHPSVGLILEREVPKGGALISGKQIPAGIIVGINAWVLHRNSQIFQDPDAFIPERWLDSPPDVLREMERSFLSFGAGSRTCIGKNISLIEMHKIVPQLLRDFDIRLHNPEKGWTVRNTWFVQQEDFICDIKERNSHVMI